MKTYQYEKSRELFKKAVNTIPAGIYGHLGPSSGCFIPVEAYPFYAEKAKGSYVWDVDGNRFIDYMCAYGPIILGYNHPEVEAAADEQRKKIDCGILPSAKMIELAELLVDTVDSADWAFFAKNGGDTTNLALMTARAATGRKKVIKFKGGYHGVVQWTQALGYPGIIEEDITHVLNAVFNDYESVAKLVSDNKNEVAAIIATPYHHPALYDNAVPVEGFWQKIRKLCDDNGIVLIIDDVRAGFRLDVRGSDHYYGFKADLICFCKALANGHNISALCGRDSLKAAASSVFYTGSYWLSAVPMAAAIKNIEIMRKIDVAKLLLENGRKLTNGLKAAAAKNGLELSVTGEPSMWFMRILGDESWELHQKWVAECVKRGVFFTNHHNLFMNAAMSDEDIKFTIEVADEAFKIVQEGRK